MIRQHLGNLEELIIQFNLKLHIRPMPSEQIKVDALRRVRKTWLGVPEDSERGVSPCQV